MLTNILFIISICLFAFVGCFVAITNVKRKKKDEQVQENDFNKEYKD